MLRKTALLLVLLTASALLIYSLTSQTPAPHRLTVYCAAGLKKPVEAIAAQYQQETGIPVSLQYGGTGTLLTQLRIANRGDLLLAADEGSLADARKLRVILEDLPIALQRPVIAVAKGNPKNIRSLADLHRPDVRLALTNPEAAAIGKVTQRLLGPRWQPLAAKAVVMKPTVTEVAADTQLGAVDAALVWDSLMPQYPALQAVRIPELSDHIEAASAAVLTSSTAPAQARRFAHYLTAPDRGGAHFKTHGFQPAGGAPWTE